MKTRRQQQQQQHLTEQEHASPEAMSDAQGLYGNNFLRQLAQESAPGDVPYRSEMEAAFGEDFSAVSAFTDQRDLLSTIDARAAATGESVAFAEANPDRELVAHELTHIVQQRNSGDALQRSGLSRSGDNSEREADAVSTAVAAGQAAPEVAAAPTAGIHREEETLENDVDVREGEGACFEMGDDAEALLDAFITGAKEEIGTWGQTRAGSDLYFNDADLKQRWLDFQSEWTQLSSNTDTIAFRNIPEAWEEGGRRLNTGTTKQFVEEIRFFNSGALSGYAELLDIETGPFWHHYDLLTVLAVSGGIDIGVGVEVAVAEYEIRYSNDLKMSWSQNTNCRSGGAGFGVGTPISVNFESSLDEEMINAGSADTITYFSPDFFDAAVLGYVAGEALAGGGAGLGAIEFSNFGETLSFDTSGLIARVGTDIIGSAGTKVGGGVCLYPVTEEGVDLGEAAPVEEQPREGAWESLIEAGIFFPTGDASLDSDDVDTIKEVASAIAAHEKDSRGDIFQIAVIGSASNRWRGDTDEDSPEELNKALAQDRADAVETGLDVELSELSHTFTEGVFDESKMAALTRDSKSTDPDDNNQIDRSVYIQVFYNPCGEEGNVQH